MARQVKSAKKQTKARKPRPPPTPKTPRPWDAPPPPEKGDEDSDVLYAAIGRALSEWEHLEEELARIFSSLVVGGEGTAAERSYGAVATFRGRMDMIEAAAEAFFFLYPDDRSSLGNDLHVLITSARSFGARRNEIAHGIVRHNVRTGDWALIGLFALSAPRRQRVPGYVLSLHLMPPTRRNWSRRRT